MARVQYNELAVNSRGMPDANQPVSIKVKSGAAGTATAFISEEGSEALAPLETNAHGVFSCWLEEGRYEITIGTETRLFEAVNQTTVAEGATGQKVAFAGGTSGITGYVGPLISCAVSKEGVEEANFLEAVEQYFDGCTPEVALKPEVTYKGSTNPKKADVSNFLNLYKQIGAKKRWRGHTLCWYQGLGQWMFLPSETINGVTGTWTGTASEYRTQFLAYVKQVVEAVGTKVDSWDVLNELTNSGALRQCVFTELFGKSLTVSTSNEVVQFYGEVLRAVELANPSAFKFVNEYEVETTFNYSTGTSRGTVFLEFVEALQSLHTSNPSKYGGVDGVGFQFHTNTGRLVTEAETQSIVPKYTEKELAVEFTEFDCEIKPGSTETKQGEVYEAAIQGAKKSGVGRVTIWGVTDKRTWLKTQWEAGQKLTSDTAENSSVLNMTGAESKNFKSATPQVQVRFSSVTAGCGFSTGTTYYILSGSSSAAFELATSEGGTAIKVTAGKTLKASETTVGKWGGETSPYPRPTGFSWLGAVKPAWRSMERSRPESPGISEWKTVTLNTKAEAVALFQTPGARTEGLNVRLRGQIAAKSGESVTNGEAALTLPAGCRPLVKTEIAGVATGPTVVTLLIEPSGTVTCSKTLASTEKLRLDGLTFAKE